METEYERWLADQGLKYQDGFMPGYPMDALNRSDWEKILKDKDSGLFTARCRQIRKEAIALFSFAIPSAFALRDIAAEGPILEVGAGGGYWAYELRKMGVDVVAVDPAPHSDNTTTGWKDWGGVLRMTATEAIDKFPGRTLLTVWPSLKGQWAYNALKQYSGKTVIYVGEDAGGCTGTPAFHDYLAERFTERKTGGIPIWAGIHDLLFVYDRK